MTPEQGDQAILELALSNGYTGLSINALSGRSGRTKVAVRNVVLRLRNQGLVESSHPGGGSACRWGPPGTRALWESTASGREKRRQQAQALREEARKQKAIPKLLDQRHPSVWAFAQTFHQIEPCSSEAFGSDV